MSERNREHFDIEAKDHLEHLKKYPGDIDLINRSLMHRIMMHKTRNMYLVPPMLIKRTDESDSEHMKREAAAWGIVDVDTFIEVVESMQQTIINGTSEMEPKGFLSTFEDEPQEELFQCQEHKAPNIIPD